MKHIDGSLRGWRKGSEKSPRSAQDRVTSRTETRTSSPIWWVQDGSALAVDGGLQGMWGSCLVPGSGGEITGTC